MNDTCDTDVLPSEMNDTYDTDVLPSEMNDTYDTDDEMNVHVILMYFI